MSIEVGVLFSVLSLILGVLGYQVNKTNQQIKRQHYDKQEVRKESQQEVKLDYISRGVDEIRIDLRANEKQIASLGERVTRVEESAKSAHRRIDNVEKESV